MSTPTTDQPAQGPIYDDKRVGLIVKVIIVTRFGDSAEAKRRVADGIGMELSKFYRRLGGAPGFTIGELQAFVDWLADPTVTVESICDGQGILPRGSVLPFPGRRRTSAPTQRTPAKGSPPGKGSRKSATRRFAGQRRSAVPHSTAA